MSSAAKGLKSIRLSRAAALGVVLFLLGPFMIGATSATADEPLKPPSYDGGMTFEAIHGPADPEEYSWTVELGEEQVLRLIDDQHAAVYYSDRQAAFSITAEQAHDANGSSVPTTLAVSDGDVVTLIVHHRAGNPAAGGAPFVYPIVGGPGWEGGFHTYYVPMPPYEPVSGDSSTPAVTPGCVVPRLTGGSVKASRLKLRAAGCGLGEIRGARSKTAKVVRQYPAPGTARAAGAEVAVKLDG